jgi:hypothetical protein
MAAPRILCRINRHLRPNRVQVDVADQFGKIGICIDHNCLITPLEQMPYATFAPVYPTRVPSDYTLQNTGERDIPHLQGDVDMISHQAKGMYAKAVTLDTLLKK